MKEYIVGLGLAVVVVLLLVNLYQLEDQTEGFNELSQQGLSSDVKTSEDSDGLLPCQDGIWYKSLDYCHCPAGEAYYPLLRRCFGEHTLEVAINVDDLAMRKLVSQQWCKGGVIYQYMILADRQYCHCPRGEVYYNPLRSCVKRKEVVPLLKGK